MCLTSARRKRNLGLLVALLALGPVRAPAQEPTHGHAGRTAWKMPEMEAGRMMMLPGMAEYEPPLTPFVPGADVDPEALPEARPNEMLRLNNGDTLDLTAGLVRRTIEGRAFVMYGFNEQYPGPLLRVSRNTTIVVRFHNEIELPTAIHWHGLRHDNRFDGVPGVTQAPVEPGESFTYEVSFPDPGIYWYHPHHREDIQQEMGLYGNMLVDALDEGYFAPAHREEFLVLDDLLLQDGDIAPFGLEAANLTLMGRFGNLFLVNGEPDYRDRVSPGSVVRYFITNVSNTRIFNLGFGGAPIKVVGGDIGRLEREVWTPSVVVAPAERYIVDVRFPDSGEYPLTNSVQAVDHFMGRYYARVDTLGLVTVSGETALPHLDDSYQELRHNEAVTADIDRYRAHFDRAPDHELHLTIRAGNLPAGMIQFMSIDTAYFQPVEMNNSMPMMNWVSNAHNVTWVLRDADTGRENMEIDWTSRVGEVIKIRLVNDARSFHPMSHPIHLHGQRFLVLARNAAPNEHLVWKETVLVPVGATVDILLDVTNPGRWMLHCHIAEHLEAGMKMVLDVVE